MGVESPKYSQNGKDFCQVTHNEMAFSEILIENGSRFCFLAI